MTREDAIADIRDNIKPVVGRKSLDMAIKALEQEPCENPHIYECPCGYGWDKSKVVRHHFCPNCGRKVQEVEE